MGRRTQSDDAAKTVFRALREGDGSDDNHAGPDHTDPADETADVGAAHPSGDLVEHLRQHAEALIDDADKLAISWLEEAEVVREEALGLRRHAEEELAAVRDRVQEKRDALIQEATDQSRAEADRILQDARDAARQILEEAAEEGRFSAKTEADELRREAERASADILRAATAEAERITAEARREEARVLLDARARVDEVRGRLIRLYQEMEAATAARWGQTSTGSRELAEGSQAGHRTDDS